MVFLALQKAWQCRAFLFLSNFFSGSTVARAFHYIKRYQKES